MFSFCIWEANHQSCRDGVSRSGFCSISGAVRSVFF